MSVQKIVVNAIIWRDGRVLLARRARHKKIAPGKFHLPGGHVEFGETAEDALVRELEEEFGVTVAVDQVFGTFSYVEDDEHTIGITFVATKAVDKIQPINDENDAVAWVSVSDLGKYLDTTDHDFVTLERYFAVELGE